VRIVTWNVNSLRARLERVQEWLAANQPDICLLQETKCSDDAFPTGAFAELGYATAHHGNGRWNGVAIASRIGLDDVRPGFLHEDPSTIEECRIIAATCAGTRVMSVYVPNGRSLESEQYVAKLAWLERLRTELDECCNRNDSLVVAGDFNIAPEDRDVWDIAEFIGATHVSQKERDALKNILAWGLTDAVREANPEGPGPFSWWDYRGGAFHRGWGMRIDHVLLSRRLAEVLEAAHVDREARKGQGTERQPSDHAPVVVDLKISSTS